MTFQHRESSNEDDANVQTFQYFKSARRAELVLYVVASKKRLLDSGGRIAKTILERSRPYDERQRRDAREMLHYLEHTFRPWMERFESGEFTDIDILERGLRNTEQAIVFLETHLLPEQLPDGMRLEEKQSIQAELAARGEPIRVCRSSFGGYYVDLPKGWTIELVTLTGALQRSHPPIDISAARQRHYLPEFVTSDRNVSIRTPDDAVAHYFPLIAEGRDFVSAGIIGEARPVNVAEEAPVTAAESSPDIVETAEVETAPAEPEQVEQEVAGEVEKTEAPSNSDLAAEAATPEPPEELLPVEPDEDDFDDDQSEEPDPCEVQFESEWDSDLSKINFKGWATDADLVAIFGSDDLEDDALRDAGYSEDEIN